MKRLNIFLASLILVMGFASASSARECGSEAMAVLRKIFPNFEFQEVNPTPIPGIFEVLSENNIVYFAPETGHLIFGEIWSRDGKNITAENKERRMAGIVEDLPLDKAVKVGNGRNRVIEFTDPDCPFCRKGAEFFRNRTDVTRYIFFMPLPGLHPDSSVKARYILSAPDQAKAYEEVMTSVYDDQPLPPFIDNGLLKEHQQIAATLRINSTPKYWINSTPVAGADLKRIERLLEPFTGEKTTSTK